MAALLVDPPLEKQTVPLVGQGAGKPLPIGCLLCLNKRKRHGSTVMSASLFSGSEYAPNKDPTSYVAYGDAVFQQ
jgi:hypothetical protein